MPSCSTNSRRAAAGWLECLALARAATVVTRNPSAVVEAPQHKSPLQGVTNTAPYDCVHPHLNDLRSIGRASRWVPPMIFHISCPLIIQASAPETNAQVAPLCRIHTEGDTFLRSQPLSDALPCHMNIGESHRWPSQWREPALLPIRSKHT